MVATGEMSVRLHLRRLRVTRVLVDEIDRLEVEVADTRAVVLCPWCGHKASRVHETRWVVIRDVPLGWPTTLVWLQPPPRSVVVLHPGPGPGMGSAGRTAAPRVLEPPGNDEWVAQRSSAGGHALPLSSSMPLCSSRKTISPNIAAASACMPGRTCW